jgi:hypothetical protein
MARKPTARIETVLFDVIYEDGSQTSRRKVLSSVVSGLEGDDAALAVFEQQDREIAERSGRPRGPIKSIVRSDVR